MRRRFEVSLTEEMIDTVDHAAKVLSMTRVGYVREAIIAHLRLHGINPVKPRRRKPRPRPEAALPREAS